ncbi:MAG: hypothetical protein NVSMB9_00580 [Isosphaeraceae bacterium]
MKLKSGDSIVHLDLFANKILPLPESLRFNRDRMLLLRAEGPDRIAKRKCQGRSE